MTAQEMYPHVGSAKRENLQKFSWKEYAVLTHAGLFGSAASIPSVYSYIADTATKTGIPVQLLLGEQIVQSLIYLLLAVGIGLLLSRKTGLGAPILREDLDGKPVGHKLKPHILPSLTLGIASVLAIKTLDIWFFMPRMRGFTSVISPVSGWRGLLASFYGGITEEILTRLFFLTLLAWTLSWFSHTKDNKPSQAAMWNAVVGSAILFGLGHLPATLLTNSFSPIILAAKSCSMELPERSLDIFTGNADWNLP